MPPRSLTKTTAAAVTGFVAGAALALFIVWVENGKPVEQDAFTAVDTIKAVLVLGAVGAGMAIVIVTALSWPARHRPTARPPGSP